MGSLTRDRSLVVTDTFGVRMLLRPIGDRALPRPNWSMFQLAHTRRRRSTCRAGEQPLFLAAGARPTRWRARRVEEVLFMRDEMANMAWAIERAIESRDRSAHAADRIRLGGS